MSHSVVIIVQARMGSERLPGKVMKAVLGKPLLGYLIDQLQRVSKADKVVIATSTSANEAPIVDYCASRGIACFRGSLLDVLDRYDKAAEEHGATTIVRICSDCPLIDPAIVDQVIGYYLDHQPDYDYVSNCLERTYPRGQDVEVFSRQTLTTAAREAKLPEEREHVTPFLYRHPERFRLGSVKGAKDYSALRWVVDTPNDLALITKLLEAVVPHHLHFGMQDVLEVLRRHPEWGEINAHVKQKEISK